MGLRVSRGDAPPPGVPRRAHPGAERETSVVEVDGARDPFARRGLRHHLHAVVVRAELLAERDVAVLVRLLRGRADLLTVAVERRRPAGVLLRTVDADLRLGPVVADLGARVPVPAALRTLAAAALEVVVELDRAGGTLTALRDGDEPEPVVVVTTQRLGHGDVALAVRALGGPVGLVA